VAKFKYLRTTLTDQNCMHEEIKSRLNSGNTCHHSVQSLLSTRLLSRNVKIKTYRTIILSVVLCGCETWSPALREEHRLRVFENRVLRRIFGPKRDQVTGEWRKMHNGELHNLYSSPDIKADQIKENEVGGACGTRGRGEKRVQGFYGKPEGKRPLERPKRRWENGIRMDLRENGWGGLEWIHLAQDRDRWRAVVNAVMNLRVLAPQI
jgi:hypothetical protein